MDEYKTIRFIDRAGFSQEPRGEFMQVDRTTVQQVYANTRKKRADVLADGLPLRIEGGDYPLCWGGSRSYGYSNCYRQKLNEQGTKSKRKYIMRIAAAYENSEIFQYLGRTEQFKVYDTEDRKILSSQIVDTNSSGHGALAGVLSALRADVLTGGAQMVLAQADVKLFGDEPHACGDYGCVNRTCG